MFEGFNDRGRQVIEVARRQAQELHEDAVGTEHLLLGVLADEYHFAGSDAATPLIEAGLDEQRTYQHVCRVRSGPRPPDAKTAGQIVSRLGGSELGFSERATKTLELALRSVLQTSPRPRGAPRPPITPTHMLLGLLDQPDNGALRALLALDIDIPALRRRAIAAVTRAADGPVEAVSSREHTPEHTPERSPAFVAASQLPSTSVEPTLMNWLRDTRYGSHLVSQYLAILGTLARAGSDPRVDVPPDDVLVSWHRELARLRTMRLQCELGFLDAAARAGWTEAAITRALAIPADQTVAEHRSRLETEQDHYHPSRHPHPWTG